jgi:FkbM family methyltransferase
MKQHQGIWLPDGEQHLIGWMDQAGEIVDGKGSYQIKKLRTALTHVKRFGNALDIGGHCGLWSMQLAKRFERVHAFEPVAAHRECFVANIPGTCTGELDAESFHRVYLHACALGAAPGRVRIESKPDSSGDSRVAGEGDIPMYTLDSFEFEEVDFVKIDCEGYELMVIRGGEETIKRCRPTMIVEQKGHGMRDFGFRKEEGVELLEAWGMRRVLNMSGDIIMVWPD